MNFQCPFLHLDLACVTGIQRRGPKGEVCVRVRVCVRVGVCVCVYGGFEMN